MRAEFFLESGAVANAMERNPEWAACVLCSLSMTARRAIRESDAARSHSYDGAVDDLKRTADQ